MKYTAIIHGERIEVDLKRLAGDAIEAEIGGRKYVLEARLVEPGVFWFNWENGSIEIAVTANGDDYLVSLPERRVSVEMLDTLRALRRAAQATQAGVAEIRAPMPGKVIKLLVAEGAAVQANQGLLVMEAMKMQNEIRSPKPGVVRKLGVREGTAVNSGDLLAAVE